MECFIDEPQTQITLNTQSSSSSSVATTATIGTFSSVLSTPASRDITSAPTTNRFNEPYLSDQSLESSDDEDSQPVARPPTTHSLSMIAPVYSPPPPPTSAPLHEALRTVHAQTCSDPGVTNGHTQVTSPGITSQMNPFEQLHIQQQQRNAQLDDHAISPNSNTHDVSPAIAGSLAISSPVDVPALLAHELHRLDTFKRQDRQTFANVDCAHLAYVGFYLNAEGNLIQCPWCEIRLSEQDFEDVVRSRPSVARSTLSDEPWTPMRVHRHVNGIVMDQNHPWCTWVRREAGGLYPNVTIVGYH